MLFRNLLDQRGCLRLCDNELVSDLFIVRVKKVDHVTTMQLHLLTFTDLQKIKQPVSTSTVLTKVPFEDESCSIKSRVILQCYKETL